jgi:hypothetical protein
MHETNLSTVATMGMDQGAVREFKEQGAPLNHLPKSVRFLGEAPTETDCMPNSSAGMYEFEVVTGNAAYREGERFYLTPAQAQRVYLLVLPDHQ